MDGILPLQSCTASAGLLSDGKTLVLVAVAFPQYGRRFGEQS